jgi:hypothetical protein
MLKILVVVCVVLQGKKGIWAILPVYTLWQEVLEWIFINVRREGVNWIQLAQYGDQIWARLITVFTLPFSRKAALFWSNSESFYFTRNNSLFAK